MNRIKVRTVGVILYIIAALAAGCTTAPATPTPKATSIISPTLTPALTPTTPSPTISLTPSLTPISTPTPIGPTATATPSGAPSISIVQPPMNTYVVGTNDISVVVQVSGFDLVDKIGQPNVSGQGHINYFIHADSPGIPQVTAPGAYVSSAATSYTWTVLAEGVYTFSVELVNNDNTPLVPPVVAKSTVTVYPG